MKRRKFLALSFGVPATGLVLANGGRWLENSTTELIPEVVDEVTFEAFLVDDFNGARFGPIYIRTIPVPTPNGVEWQPFGNLKFDGDEIVASGIETLCRIEVDVAPVMGPAIGWLPTRWCSCNISNAALDNVKNLGKLDNVTIEFSQALVSFSTT